YEIVLITGVVRQCKGRGYSEVVRGLGFRGDGEDREIDGGVWCLSMAVKEKVWGIDEYGVFISFNPYHTFFWVFALSVSVFGRFGVSELYLVNIVIVIILLEYALGLQRVVPAYKTRVLDNIFTFKTYKDVFYTFKLFENIFIQANIRGSLKANLQHMEALSKTKAGYMTFTEAWKKKIWLKGLLIESRYELRLVVGIATGALVKGSSWSEVPTQVDVAAKYVEGEIAFVEMIDIQQFKTDVLYSARNNSGYNSNATVFFHYKIPMKGLDNALNPLASDTDICNMLEYVHKHKIMYVYVENGHTTIGISNDQPLKNIIEIKEFVLNDEDSNGDESKSNDVDGEAEDIVDEEHIVDEVDVIVIENDFKVLDIDSFESDVDVENQQSARRKGPRKLRKIFVPSGIKNNLFVGKEFANRNEAKEKIRDYLIECIRNIDF
nr:transposase, mutator type [Tanacetum cinerariifolium]